jgi:3-hydroxyacyl-[acyl-carrier-protein] dehydratase
MNAPQRRGRGLRGRTWIVPPAEWNVDRVVADLATIRHYNPQRCEMEQLTAVIHEDPDRHVCLGYKDLAHDEFWVRGCAQHPPTMPRTLMCEAAAQLANYYALKHNLYASPGAFLGLSDVRWRGNVHPGERLFVMAKLLKIRAAVLTCRFQCADQRRELLCDGILTGTPLREW